MLVSVEPASRFCNLQSSNSSDKGAFAVVSEHVSTELLSLSVCLPSCCLRASVYRAVVSEHLSTELLSPSICLSSCCLRATVCRAVVCQHASVELLSPSISLPSCCLPACVSRTSVSELKNLVPSAHSVKFAKRSF